jgi:hypothetical protein
MARVGKLKEGDLLKFTMDYNHVIGLFGRKKIKQGKKGMVTRIYSGFMRFVHHVDIKLPDGTLLKEVPVRYISGS